MPQSYGTIKRDPIRVTNHTQPGTRVRVDCPENRYHGLTGTVRMVSPVSHATMNGGGWDVEVVLDDNPFQTEDLVRKAELHASLGISPEYTQAHAFETRIRSTALVLR